MRAKICCIYDCKSESYGRPFFSDATGAAIRSFSDEANSTSKESTIANHPGDYTLFEIGTYDHQSGVIEVYEAKKSLGCALDFVRSELKAV